MRKRLSNVQVKSMQYAYMQSHLNRNYFRTMPEAPFRAYINWRQAWYDEGRRQAEIALVLEREALRRYERKRVREMKREKPARLPRSAARRHNCVRS